MTRRLFYVALGATAGVLLVRRATRAAARITPAGLQSSLSAALGDLGEDLRAFADDVREAAAEREAELRTVLGLDGSNDLIDAHTYS